MIARLDKARPASRHSSNGDFFDGAFGEWGDEDVLLLNEAVFDLSSQVPSERRNHSPPTWEGIRNIPVDAAASNTMYYAPFPNRSKRIDRTDVQMSLRGQALIKPKVFCETNPLIKSPTKRDGMPFPRMRTRESKSRGTNSWLLPEDKEKMESTAALRSRMSTPAKYSEHVPVKTAVRILHFSKLQTANSTFGKKIAIGPTWGREAFYNAATRKSREQIHNQQGTSNISLLSRSPLNPPKKKLSHFELLSSQNSAYNRNLFPAATTGVSVDPVVGSISSVQKMKRIMRNAENTASKFRLLRRGVHLLNEVEQVTTR